MLQTARIAMLVLYTLVTAGLHISTHQCCCGDSYSVSLVESENAFCAAGDDSCCEKECGREGEIDIRLEHEHLGGDKLTFRSWDVYTPGPEAAMAQPEEQGTPAVPALGHKRPPDRGKLFILHRSLIMYG
jgi:hypothetical protein